MRPVLHAVCASAAGTQLQTSPEEENWLPHVLQVPNTPSPLQPYLVPSSGGDSSGGVHRRLQLHTALHQHRQ